MKWFVLFAGCLMSVFVQAQSSIDLLTLGGSYGFPASYDKPLNGKATELSSLINLKAPIVINDKTIWYNDFTYTGYSIRHNMPYEPDGMLTTLNLHAFILQTGIDQKLNERDRIQIFLVPRYTTDLEGSRSENWQLGAIGLCEHRMSSRLLMRFGMMYNGELFGPLLVPLVYMDWQLNNRWSITGLMPISLKVNYKVNNWLTAGYSHFGFITTYAINHPEFETDYIERNSIDETLFLRWKLMGNLHLETRFGYSLSRVYGQYLENQKMDLRLSLASFGDHRLQRNIDFDSGPILSARVVYNLRLEEAEKK